MVLMALLHPGSAQAVTESGGGKGQNDPKRHFPVDQIAAFAGKVETFLAANDVRVALVARKGRPQSEMPEGMSFTHVGFAVRSSLLPDAQTTAAYTMYNAYQKDEKPDTSELITDSPESFFAHVFQLEAGILIPSAKMQEQLLEVIQSPIYRQLHDPHYSVIANPFSLGRQNCTEFVLDVLTAAKYQVHDLEKIKEIEQKEFAAQKVKVHPAKIVLAALFKAEVSLSDHQSLPVTATFETITEYMKNHDPACVICKLPTSD